MRSEGAAPAERPFLGRRDLVSSHRSSIRGCRRTVRKKYAGRVLVDYRVGGEIRFLGYSVESAELRFDRLADDVLSLLGRLHLGGC
jgi:hypothetical protein